MTIERTDQSTGEKTYLSLEAATAEIKTYGIDFFDRYFNHNGIWLTDKAKYERTE